MSASPSGMRQEAACSSGKAEVHTPATAHKASIKIVVVPNQLGLHARPAALIIQTLQAFGSNVVVECQGEIVNAKSILGLLSLAAGQGSELTFTATGPDAAQALAAVENLFRRILAKAP